MFQTDLLSISRSLTTVFTEIGIRHDCLLAGWGCSVPTSLADSTTNTNFCEYSSKTPDGGQ